MIEETITRIPKSSTLEKSYSTLVQTGSNAKGNHENLRLVLNMAIQDNYSPTAKPDFQLPAVIDRQRESMPVQIYQAQQLIGNEAFPRKRYMENYLDNGSDGTMVSKRRK